jgi:hypothetical protein
MENQASGEPLKKCPKCQTSISAKAKKCPNCQSDLRNWFMRHKVLTGIGVLIVIIIIAGAGGKSNNKTNSGTASSSNSSAQEPIKKTYKIGETITANTIEATITSVETKNKVGTEFLNSTPAEGGVYVVVQWKYKNTSDKSIGAFSQPRIQLVDTNSNNYDSDIGASANFATEVKLDNKILSDVNPGITVNDAKVFEVSKDKFSKGSGWTVSIKADGQDFAISI